MNRSVDDKEHKEWLARNRHLLGFGDILALGEELTPEERAKVEAWYRVKDQGSKP
jgi:hypothetical protein